MINTSCNKRGKRATSVECIFVEFQYFKLLFHGSRVTLSWLVCGHAENRLETAGLWHHMSCIPMVTFHRNVMIDFGRYSQMKKKKKEDKFGLHES